MDSENLWMIDVREQQDSWGGRRQAPRFPDVGVVGLIPDTWGSPWMARHHVFTRLAEYFHVVWMDPPRGWREYWLGPCAPGPACRHTVPLRPGFGVYTPGRWLARFYRPAFLARAAERRASRNAARVLKKRRCRRIIVYLWRPEFDVALDYIDHEISCYHLDDEYTFSRHELPTDPREARLLKRVDHVFLHSPALWEKKSSGNPNTHLVPMGADYRSFATPRREPEDLGSIPRPRIGYVGYVKGQLNFPLLTALGRMHPDWSFVFVGPCNANMPRYALQFEALCALPNVYMLGERHVGRLPAYMQHMDVLTLAYRINDYTKFISPMKLQEYLATGRPVVGSPIGYLRHFAGVIALAETEEQWSDALCEALRPESGAPERAARRQGIAKAYDWDRVVLHIARVLCGSLGDDYLRDITEAYGPDPELGRPGHDLVIPAVAAT